MQKVHPKALKIAEAKLNSAPFNSSSRRALELSTGDGVGVGIYDNGAADRSWMKKSFNINHS